MFGLFKKSPTRFCIDCKFYELHGSMDLCLRNASKVNKDIDPVTGRVLTVVDRNESLCEYERGLSYSWRCGSKAKFFKPKENV
jgi:hypothetical protein